MKKLKALTIMCSALAMLFGLGLSNDKASPVFAESNEPSIYTDQEIEFKNSYSEYIPIKASNLTCSGLEIEIHYDTRYFQNVTSVYSNQTFDESKQEFFESNSNVPGVIKAAYLFKKDRTFTDDTLLYFYLNPKTVNEDVTSHLDIIIGNVINAAGDKINVKTHGGYLNIHKNQESQSQDKYIYNHVDLNKSEIYKDQTLKYDLDNSYGHEYRSGEILIEYDRDLLEFQNIQFAPALQNSFNDVNSKVKGVIFISFINDTDISSYGKLFTINFKCIKSINIDSEIKTTFKLIADKDNNKLKTENIVSKFRVLETPTVEVKPRLYLNDTKVSSLANFDIDLYIDEKSNLGAADLTLTFDINKLSYVKNTKENINSIMIGVNERKAKEGIITISLLSTKGINEALKLASFTFITTEDIVGTTNINLVGKNIKDPLIKPLDLEFKGSTIELTTHVHGHGEWTVIKNPTYIYEGTKESTCPICGTKVTASIPKLLTDEEYNEVYTYATNFIAANVCGTNDNTSAISELFLKQAEAYKNLSAKAQEALSKTKANSMSENIIEQCLAKYDRIMFLHNNKENTKFPDFMNRVNNPEVQEPSNLANQDSHLYFAFNFTYIVMLLGVLGIGVFTVCMVMKRKKEHKNK